MSFSEHGRCSVCRGDGKCWQCDGTGINPHIDEPEPKCQRCSGAGGRAWGKPKIQDLGLDKL